MVACAPAAGPVTTPTASAVETTAAPPPPPTSSPVASPTASAFYARFALYDGFLVKASANVDPLALAAATSAFALLIAGDPAVVDRLRTAPVSIAIVARSEAITDLPEYAHLRGRTSPDGRPYDSMRGLGGSTCVAAEENLLGLPGDVHAGENILVHECAHAVFTYGLDETQHFGWIALYRNAMGLGRWRGTYAAVDPDEYFAELTQSYFGLNPAAEPGIHNGVNGAAALAAYDREAYEFLVGVFGPPARAARTRA